MSTIDRKHDEEEVMLPGFRFHPTDEELVAFYLRRKVRNKQLSIELIKQIDIYKYDPWELPTTTAGANNQEWYFFCLRGRKYRNSVRPNRVTGSGFWKATGIDKPIYSFKEPQKCIGLKKSLVYYRGSAGKGTKTDWMMHEFRLPPQLRKSAGLSQAHAKTNNIPQEAEVWTVCRIFKRITTYKKYIPSQQPQPQPQPGHNFSSSPTDYSTSKTYSNESDQKKNNSTDNSSSNSEIYLNFADHSTYGTSIAQQNRFTTQSSLFTSGCNSFQQRLNDPANSAGFWDASGDVMFAGDDCDELRPVVDPYRVDSDRMYYDCK